MTPIMISLALMVFACAASVRGDLSSEYAGSLELDGGAGLWMYWTLDPLNEAVSFALQAPNIGGYIALGLAPDAFTGMVGSTAVIGFPPANNRGVFEYHLTGQDSNGIVKVAPDRISAKSATVSGGQLTVRWTRPYSLAEYTINPLATQYLIWSVGTSAGTLSEHLHRGRLSLNLSAPTCRPACTPPDRSECVGYGVCACRPGWAGANCAIREEYAPFDRAFDYRFDVPTARALSVWWTVNSTHLRMATRAATTGYIAIGFSPSGQMVPDSIVVIGRSGPLVSGGSDIAEHRLEARAESSIIRLSTPLIDANVTESGGFTAVSWVRPLSAPAYTIDPAASLKMIWAIGSLDSITQHSSSDRGHLTASLAAGLMSGESEDRAYLVAHGALMFIAFGVLIPLAVLAARFEHPPPPPLTVHKEGPSAGSPPQAADPLPSARSPAEYSPLANGAFFVGAKHYQWRLFAVLRCPPRLMGEQTWFTVHRSLNVLAVCCAVAGFGLAVKDTDRRKVEHFSIAHSRVGLTIMCALFAQAINGMLRAAKGASWRAHWELGHHALGYCTLALALANLFYGLTVYGAAESLIGLLAAWVGLLLAYAVFREVYELVQSVQDSRRRGTHPQGPEPSRSDLAVPMTQLESEDRGPEPM